MKLAARQEEALTHRAHGLTNAETAMAMHCSVANVNNLLRECYFKLVARGAPDAIAKAVSQGLISLCLCLCIITNLSASGNDQPFRLRGGRQGQQITRTLRNPRKDGDA